MMTAMLPLMLGLATVGQSAPASAVAPADRAPAAATESRQTVLIRLKDVRAEDLSDSMRGVVDGVDLAIDQRTNSIIATGRAESIKQLKEIVARLDVPVSSESDTRLRVFVLGNITPDDAVTKLTTIGKKGAVNLERINFLAVNETRQLIVRGTVDQMKVIGELLRKLDVPATVGGSLSVQIHCLIAGQDAELTGSRLAFEGAENVVLELTGLGIRRPELLFTAAARVEVHSEFEVAGSAARNVRVEIDGNGIERIGNTVTLNIGMSLALPGGEEACTIRTTIRAPLGDLVIIGVAPHEGGTVILVLRIVAH